MDKTLQKNVIEISSGSRVRFFARAWLVGYLSHNWPAPAKRLIEDAALAGIASRTLETAKKELGVKAIQHGGAWYWQPGK